MRRHAVTIILLLPLGLVLSAGFVVLSGMKVDGSWMRVVANGSSFQPSGYGWNVQVQRGFGKRHVVSDLSPHRLDLRERRTVEQVIPGWARDGMRSTVLEGQRVRQIEAAYGWPAPMLRGTVELDRWGGIADTRGFILTAAPSGAMPAYGYQLRGVPLRPMWWGVVINSIVWAGIAWVVVVGPRQLRRAWRAYHNLCIFCTYDLRGGPHPRCPECGTAVA